MRKILGVAAVFLAALTILIYVGMASAVPIVSVAELKSAGCPAGNVEVKDSKVVAIESLTPLRFSVAQREGAGSEPIRVEARERYNAPDNFKVGIDVGIQGEFDPATGVFHAYRITTKCPSRYEASKDGEYVGGDAYPAPGAVPPAAVDPLSTKS